MIASLAGTLTHKSPTDVVVNVHGVGYAVSIPVSTFEALGGPHTQVTLYTYLHVREDALQLYGFATEEERSAFKLLISVTGIGPKMAQGILSGITVAELRQHIAQNDLNALTKVPGIGKKLGERLVMELRDKVQKIDEFHMPTAEADAQASVHSEALLALTSLGFTRTGADKALRAALQELKVNQVTVEELIKTSLRLGPK